VSQEFRGRPLSRASAIVERDQEPTFVPPLPQKRKGGANAFPRSVEKRGAAFFAAMGAAGPFAASPRVPIASTSQIMLAMWSVLIQNPSSIAGSRSRIEVLGKQDGIRWSCPCSEILSG
jgi:hypothetical protein